MKELARKLNNICIGRFGIQIGFDHLVIWYGAVKKFELWIQPFAREVSNPLK